MRPTLDLSSLARPEGSLGVLLGARASPPLCCRLLAPPLPVQAWGRRGALMAVGALRLPFGLSLLFVFRLTACPNGVLPQPRSAPT
eukprot:2778478-Pyramimonas_sp.AAC.1